MNSIPHNKLPIAVVGSGASGLAAAYRLQEAGQRVYLFEKNERLGGRMRTRVRDGFLFEEGPSGLARSHTSILGVAGNAGLGAEIVPASFTLGFAGSGGEIHYFDSRHLLRDALRTPLLSVGAKLAMGRLAFELLRHRGRLDVEDLSRMYCVDHLSAEQYARQLVGDEAFENLVDPCLRALVIGESGKLSAADLLFVFRAFMSRQQFVAFRHGMGSYPQLLGRRFDCRLQAEVLYAEESADAVKLCWIDRLGDKHCERFAGVVLACDALRSAQIHGGLDPWRRAFLRERVRFRRVTAVNLALGKVPPIPACYLFPLARHHPRLVCITLEHNKCAGRAPPGKAVVGIYPTPDWSDQLVDQPDELVARALIDEAGAIIPQLREAIEFTQVMRICPAVMNSRPGYWTDMREFRRRSAGHDRRIQLAGDYFCTSSLNAASAAGERAARDLLTIIAPA